MVIPDKKVQMMDSGMAFIHSEGSYGDVLGQVKADLSSFGKVLRVSESDGGKFDRTISPDSLPESTEECDLFIDMSSALRKRYIAAKVESADQGRYIVRLKEGNRNTLLRTILTLMVSVMGVILIGLSSSSGANAILEIILIILGAVLFLGGIYILMSPSEKAQNSVRKIISALTR